MAAARHANLKFGLWSAGVWLVMVVVLVVVPDSLERWLPASIARVCGWVFASGIWVAVLERDWQRRFQPLPRFVLQVAAWLSAALTAMWVSDQFRVPGLFP
jgi:hypothetical protein